MIVIIFGFLFAGSLENGVSIQCVIIPSAIPYEML